MGLSLTDEYKAKVRYYLGYPLLSSLGTVDYDLWLAAKSVSAVLEINMNQIADSFSMSIITGLVNDLDLLRLKITAAEGRGAKVESIGKGDIVLNKDEINRLWAQHYNKCKELAQTLMVEILSHPVYQSGVVTGKSSGGGRRAIRS